MKKVLIVDDNQEHMDTLAEHLFQYDVEVITHDNIPDAHKDIFNKKIDLVLLDLHMPKYCGEQLLPAIALSKHNGKIPVIIISAYLTNDKKDELRKEGVKEFLEKPLDPQEFHKLLEKYLAQKAEG